MEKDLAIAVEKLMDEPYASIVCYPKPSKAELRKRLSELRKLGITALVFGGKREAFNLHVLGKGCVGIVTIALLGGRKIALKIRRVDADRSRMQREAEFLRKANSVAVGPALIGASRNFLLMQFVDGDLILNWLRTHGRKGRMRRVLLDVLEQCWRLDSICLDHGELSHAPKHVIVDSEHKPFIVDFETASLLRRPSNVTSMCQFLFISGAVAELITRKLGSGDQKATIETLRCYKARRVRENFEKVLEACGLQTM